MQFSIKLNKEERAAYIKICEKIWGCVPVDVDWARSTSIYSNEVAK
jgi:hypothetical protein